MKTQVERIFLSDFDGTITKIDSTDAMARKFASDGWEEVDAKWHRGELTTQQATQEILSLINATEEELEEFFRSLPLTPKFLDFIQWAEKKGQPIYIVSDGLDFNILRILNQNGVDHLPFFSNKVTFENSKMVLTSSSEDRLDGCMFGTCKCKVMENLREKYPSAQVVYIGDGHSDSCVAPKADMIFAKRILAEHCKKENIPYHPFDDFGDIMEVLARII